MFIPMLTHTDTDISVPGIGIGISMNMKWTNIFLAYFMFMCKTNKVLCKAYKVGWDFVSAPEQQKSQ